MLASENLFPKLKLDEVAAPGTPAAGEVVVYAKADGRLYLKDDTGTEVPLGGGLTNPMTTAGDIIVADTGGTPLRVAAGTNGDVLTIVGGLPTYAAPPSASPAAITTYVTDATAALGDAGTFIRMDVAGANTFTIPPNSSVAFPIGTEIHVRQVNSGATTIVAGSGVTLTKPASQSLVLKEQYSVVTIKKEATDTWAVFGHLT